MNFKSTLTRNLILAVLVAFAGNLSAQIFWSEDFAGGFPAGWTSEDISANYDTQWTWCEDSQDPPLTGCSAIWDDLNNNQTTFKSSTVGNGFLTLNSDIVAGADHIDDPHISVLTATPIDCSAQPTVWFKCESHIGTFELPADTNAILRVSADGGANWTEYTLFPGLITGATAPNVRWSKNPQASYVDITDVAGGEAAVILQWQWTGGWEYHWNLDDIALSPETLQPPNDMQVNENFYAVAPNLQTPASQVEAFGFLADIENTGINAQTGVNLDISIVNDASPGTIVYTETLGYGTVAADSLVENVPFTSEGFTPDATEATYTATYEIYSDSTDGDLSNNMISFNFEITDTVFSKENGVTGVFGPVDAAWDDDENHSWAYGNHYHVVNGTGWWATEVVFGIGNAAAMEGRSISITLYEWNDEAPLGTATGGTMGDRTPVGFANYTIKGWEGTADTSLITLALTDNVDLAPGVSLKDDTDYILMLEAESSDQTSVSFLGSDAIDYDAQALRTLTLPAGSGRYGAMIGFGNSVMDLEYVEGGFDGPGNVPVARMHIGDQKPVSSVTILSADNKVKVFPSPAQNYIDVALELAELQKEVTLSIVDITGKRIGESVLNNIQENTYRFDLGTLPVGSYFLNVRTADGVRNVPFVIAR